jgi:hypothetical protein
MGSLSDNAEYARRFGVDFSCSLFRFQSTEENHAAIANKRVEGSGTGEELLGVIPGLNCKV